MKDRVFRKTQLSTPTRKCVLKIEAGLEDGPVMEGITEAIKVMGAVPDFVGSITVSSEVVEGIRRRSFILGLCRTMRGQFRSEIEIYSGSIAMAVNWKPDLMRLRSWSAFLHEVGHGTHRYEINLGYRFGEIVRDSKFTEGEAERIKWLMVEEFLAKKSAGTWNDLLDEE